MLERFSISRILTSRQGEGFFQGFHARAYDKGALISNGEPDENGIFVVISGRLRVYLIGEDREITLFHLSPGEIFCMHSGCMIEAVDAADLRFTSIKSFEAKLTESPEFGLGLMSIFGRAMVSMMRTIENLMFLDIKKRIARFFSEYADAAPGDADSVSLDLDMTVEDVAKVIGSSRQATSTAMNSLIKEGYLARPNRRTFVVKQRKRLKAFAESISG